MKFDYLWDEPGPKMLLRMRDLYGTHEVAGGGDNPKILAWARELGVRGYIHDSIPWCGLTVAYCAMLAGWDHNPNGNPLWARNWLDWGTHQTVAMLGDVLVFERAGGGHVCLYIGEDATNYYVIGGNQKDQVCIEAKPKSMVVGIRRAPWKIHQPDNVRTINVLSS